MAHHKFSQNELEILIDNVQQAAHEIELLKEKFKQEEKIFNHFHQYHWQHLVIVAKLRDLLELKIKEDM